MAMWSRLRGQAPLLTCLLALGLLSSSSSSSVADVHSEGKATASSSSSATRRLRLRASSASSSSSSVASASAAAGAAGEVPGWGPPTWGGRSFEDSVANYNPWGKVRYVPVVGDLDPVAPLDRVDTAWSSPFTGAVPVEPGGLTSEAHASPIHGDWVDPYSHPSTFPWDADMSDSPDDPDSPLVPLADRHVVATSDKLRPPYAWRSSGDYPLVAPADRIISSRHKALGWLGGSSGFDPWPVESTEKVPGRFSKYFQQVRDREQRRQDELRLTRNFEAVDTDNNSMISREEYRNELEGKQNKTEKEAEHLWNKYHWSSNESMHKDEFGRLMKAGYDMGSINRKDVTGMLRLPGGLHRGFWGSGCACPLGGYVSGARLKIMPLAGAGKDDTALNGVMLKCTTGEEVATIEGPDGQWTEWALCPAGQRVYSVRANSQPHAPGGDNAGLASLELGCRAPDLSAFARIRFGAGGYGMAGSSFVVGGAGPSAVGGGWTQELLCGAGSAVCGAQAHVVRDKGEYDDMGMTDLRVYCCAAPVDCTQACSEFLGGVGSVRCQVCHKAAGSTSAELTAAGAAPIGGAVE